MKVFLLTSVSLFAEYGDLDSMEGPSVNSSLFTSFDKARETMMKELETEKNDAETEGYEDYKTEIHKKEVAFERGEIGSGCSWNLVTWEIVEKEI